MATRNRTEEFINLRAMRVTRRDSDDKELLERSSAMTAIPVEAPAWVAVMQSIRQIENQIAMEHQHVEELHREHLKVQFGGDRDQEAEEREIESATQSISRKFKLAESEIKSLDEVFRRDLGPDGGSNAELSILRNAKMCLVHEIGMLSKQVRDGQRRYLKALEKQKAVRDRFAGGARQRAVEDRLKEEARMDDYLQRGCTQEQVEDILINSRLADERDQEFQNILTSIKSLHEMFQDLHTLVIEQGTMLDRIDHNMTVTHERVVQGKIQLEKAAKHQEAGTFQLCVLLLVVMIIGFAIALMVKVAL
jgi:syntaxin 16